MNISKKVLVVKLISNIIISILKIRELYKNILYTNLIDNFTILKDLTSFTYDMLTLNIISIICNGLPLLIKVRKFTNRILKKVVK